MSDEPFAAFDLEPEDFPFTVEVYDKNDDKVDEIYVDGPGVFKVDSYPVEGRPYTVHVVRHEQPSVLRTVVDSSVGFSRWTGL